MVYSVPETAARSATVTCGTNNVVSVLANIPQSVPCSVGLNSYKRTFYTPMDFFRIGIWRDYGYFNSTIFRFSTDLMAGPAEVSVSDFLTNAAIPSSFAGSTVTLLNQVYSANTSRILTASVLGSDGLSYSSTFGVFFWVTSDLPNATSNYRAVFISENKTGETYSPLPNVTVDVGSGASSCVTHTENVSFEGSDVLFSYCSMNVPSQMVPLLTTYSWWNGTDIFNLSLNQTYIGIFPSSVYSDFGLSAGQQGGVYYVFFEGRVVTVQGAKEGTCNSSSIYLQTIDDQDVCTARTCPLSTFISEIAGQSVLPYRFVCVEPGYSECRTDDAYDVSYKLTCGNVCQAISVSCAQGCNSDNSGCFGEATNEYGGLGATGRFVAGFGVWGEWAMSHATFVIAMVVALIILVLSAMSKSRPIVLVGSIIAMFVFVGGLLFLGPTGVAIFVGILLIAGVFGVLKIFGGGGGGGG